MANLDFMYFLTLTTIQWVDVFTKPQYKLILTECLQFYRKNKGLQVHAYVIMSNHVHLICSVTGQYSLSEIIRDYKKYTCKKIIAEIKKGSESRSGWMNWLFNSAGKTNPNNTNYQLWQQDNHPVMIYSGKFLMQKFDYIHENPVRAGYVLSSHEYLFSSAVNYDGRSIEAPMEIDMIETWPYLLKK